MEIGSYVWDSSFTVDSGKFVITRTLVTEENVHLLRNAKLTLLQVYSSYLSHYNWNALGLSVLSKNEQYMSRMNALKNPVILV